ncbi:MAG: hypothetical protein QM831_26985 [Kofleriaceae bacterium]
MASLVHQLDRCQHLLADHLSAAIQVFGSAALGVIDLPSLVSPGQLAPPQVRAASTLYWCKCVEEAGLPEFVDALADALWTGRLPLNVGDAGSRLASYRRVDDRFSADERHAIYDRLFDGAFDEQWRALIDALCELGAMAQDLGTGPQTARIAAAAQVVAQGLSDRAVGIVGFAGREIVDHVRAAIDLLHDPELARALGGGGIWQIIRLHAPIVLGHPIDPAGPLARAESGQKIIEWLAARSGVIDAGALRVGRGDPVLRAAAEWQAAGAV